MELLKGSDILKETKTAISGLLETIIYEERPSLALFINSVDSGCAQYARQIEKDCKDTNINFIPFDLANENVTLRSIYQAIDEYNKRKDVTTIMVQFPLPEKFKGYEKKIINVINPHKLIDSPYWKMDLSDTTTWPGTPYGVYLLLSKYDIRVEGKRVTVIGRSDTVGLPLSMILIRGGATVTTCNSKTSTEALHDIIASSDIIISAAGKAQLLDDTFEYNKNQVIVDVGCNFLDGKLCGDVDFDKVADKVKAVSPVPGGAGPMTRVAILSQIMNKYYTMNSKDETATEMK